jgi:hypothetical protein
MADAATLLLFHHPLRYSPGRNMLPSCLHHLTIDLMPALHISPVARKA